MRKFFTFFAVFLFLFGVGVFFFANATMNTSPTVTILLDWTPNTNHTGMYIAKYLGFFEDEGINVKIEQPPQESSTALVAAGKVEFSIAFQDFLAPALISDTPLPIVAIAAIAQHNSAGVIYKKSVNIQNFSDIQFKNYATFDNFIELAILKYCVKISGGNFNNVNLIHAQIDNIAAALGMNIDVAWGYFGIENVIASHFNIENNFLFFRDVNPVFDCYSPVLISNINYIKNNPEIVKKVLRALSKGYTFAAKNPKIAAEILAKCVPELNADIINQSQLYMSSNYLTDTGTWGVFCPERWNNFFDWLFENDIISKKIPPDTTFTNDFLPINQ